MQVEINCMLDWEFIDGVRKFFSEQSQVDNHMLIPRCPPKNLAHVQSKNVECQGISRNVCTYSYTE